MNLVQRAVSQGGKLSPLVIPEGASSGLMNPSIFIDSDGDLLVNLRHINYTLYHAENTQRFPTVWGPLAYLHPENDLRLITDNYLCKLDKDLNVINYTKVQMQELHTPIWEFHGLEDCRLVQWEGKYYLIGVRRDTTSNGQGRMEYSEITIDKTNWAVKETHRMRIPAPEPDNSYCEKNWMPILDKPYHFIKWSMPTEVVKARTDSPSCETVVIKETPPITHDQRGGSQIIRWGSMYIAFTHEVDLFKTYQDQKDAFYRHRLIMWDEQFNFVGVSKAFTFLDARVEFCVGAATFKGDLLLTFGFQDNAAFILRVPKVVVEDLILEAVAYDIV
jgi:hypothetical protein